MSMTRKRSPLGPRGRIGIASNAVDFAGPETFAFSSDPLVLVVPYGHASAGRRANRLADVLDYEFVGLSKGSALEDHVAQHARRLGKRRPSVMLALKAG